MKWIQRSITELFFRPCWKLGNSELWEMVLFGRCQARMQDRVEVSRHSARYQSAGRCSNTELIEIRTHNASRRSRKSAWIPILVLRAVAFTRDKVCVENVNSSSSHPAGIVDVGGAKITDR